MNDDTPHSKFLAKAVAYVEDHATGNLLQKFGPWGLTSLRDQLSQKEGVCLDQLKEKQSCDISLNVNGDPVDAHLDTGQATIARGGSRPGTVTVDLPKRLSADMPRMVSVSQPGKKLGKKPGRNDHQP